MRVGHLDGKGTTYDEFGRPILRSGERLLRQVPSDNIDVSEGSSIRSMRTLFDSTAEKGTLFVTDQRLIFLRTPDPFLAARDSAYPVGIPDAMADAYRAAVLKKLNAIEYCEIELSEVEGFWVKKRTYGVLFLRSPERITRKAIMHQRGSQDDKFVVLKAMLSSLLPETEPEDRKGSCLLGKRYPFLGKRK